MPSKIRVLSEHTINKIAAGEVIENPSSVVKELVENSLDAGATDICVEIKGGGRQLVRITDDGCGMNADDALLCLERHATSKIREVEDLHTLGTMGFRGEAVPSIAAISKFTLLTCPQEQPSTGTMLIVDGGKIIKCCPAACATGTTIEVKSLFFNVPVRKKFQKSPAYDTNEILKMLSLLALGHPDIKFQLISNQQTILTTPISQAATFLDKLGERIATVLGKDFFAFTCPLEGSKGDIRLRGFIGQPTYSRHNRTGQYLFINGRGVFSPLISYTIRDGFGPSLGTNRHPVFVLHLELPGSLIDVNVHPQKREVRLRQEAILRDLLVQSVEQALQKKGLALEVELPDLPPTFAPSPFPKYSFSQVTDDESPKPSVQWNAPVLKNSYRPSPPPLYIRQEPEPLLFNEPPKSPQVPRVLTTIPSYIIVEPTSLERSREGGLCLVDQRAAHARIIYEKLCRQWNLLTLCLYKLYLFHLHSRQLPWKPVC